MRDILTSQNKVASSDGSAEARLVNSSLGDTSCYLATEPECDSGEPAEMQLLRGAYNINRKSNAQAPSPAPSVPAKPSASASTDMSAPNTPVFAGLSRPESSLSCVSSPINFSSSSSFIDRDGSVSEAAANTQELTSQQTTTGDGQIPQLIMPNLLIPRRRPFTDIGKSLGKLKVLVLGPPGIGKSSIIRSMAQICEHIVYMDTPSLTHRGNISETYASTRPYRWWRTTSSSLVTLKHKRSSTSTAEDALDRNLCFLDYTTSRDHTDRKDISAVEHVICELAPIVYKQMAEDDLISLLSSGTEPIVDAVLYMFPVTGPSTSDIQILSRLQSLTNIIPLLARVDELYDCSLNSAKEQLKLDLSAGDIQIFKFSRFDQSPDDSGVFAVSNVTERDDNVFDASILMSSTYAEPFIHTDLAGLVGCLFSPDGVAQLRHSAALKAATWVRQNRDWTTSSALVRRSYSTNPSAVMVDPIFQTQSWKRLEISGWAQSLRQSLDYERVINFTSCSHSLAEFRPKPSQTMARRRDTWRGGRKKQRPVQSFKQDPLGLIELVSHLTSSGTLAIELLSGIGVVGYLAACILRPENADRGLGALSQWYVALG